MTENDSRDVGATYLLLGIGITPLESVENLIENINKNGPTVRKWGTGQRKNFLMEMKFFYSVRMKNKRQQGWKTVGKAESPCLTKRTLKRESNVKGGGTLGKISIAPIISRSDLINQIGREIGMRKEVE
jgi:hypothetical protein